MAIIPLKQKAIVRQQVKTTTDGWTTTTLGPPVEYKVRAEEQLKVIESNSTAGGTRRTTDENAKSILKLYFNKIPPIDYDSEITFTNELGVVIKKTPILIQPIHMVNGKSTLTVVHL